MSRMSRSILTAPTSVPSATSLHAADEPVPVNASALTHQNVRELSTSAARTPPGASACATAGDSCAGTGSLCFVPDGAAGVCARTSAIKSSMGCERKGGESTEDTGRDHHGGAGARRTTEPFMVFSCFSASPCLRGDPVPCSPYSPTISFDRERTEERRPAVALRPLRAERRSRPRLIDGDPHRRIARFRERLIPLQRAAGRIEVAVRPDVEPALAGGGGQVL